MRHLEALAIALVYAVTVSLMYFLALRQFTPVHQVSTERAVAYALLKCQITPCLLNTLNQTVSVSALYVNGTPVTSGDAWVCYSAIVYDTFNRTVTRVRTCAKP
ncbi:MAG: hypothetical protein QXX32_00920 [Thermofilum sp.]|uniref:hypothetical protein n=1 Tax=Thermofilum sp. TaxID=1961369 RepID=UPI003161F56A